MESKRVFSFSVLFVPAVIFICSLIFSSLAVAYANNADEKAIGVSNINTSVMLNQTLASNDLPGGITIWKSNGQIAVENTDFTYDDETKKITIVTDGLKIKGISAKNPVNVCIYISNPSVKNLTLENLNMRCEEKSSVLSVDYPDSFEENAYGDNFTLTINGQVYMSQVNSEYIDGCLNFKGGNFNNNIIITGGPLSYLECYSTEYGVINLQKTPIIFSGFLETKLNSNEGSYFISWNLQAVEANSDNLTITDNAILKCSDNLETDTKESIIVGTISVEKNASFYATSKIESDHGWSFVDVQKNFNIDTNGEVYIEVFGAKSWEAIFCEGDISIKNCSNFSAISQGDAAIRVEGKLTIDTPNVYISGHRDKKLDNSEFLTGAFVINDYSNLYVSPWISAYGSEKLNEKNPTKSIVITFTLWYHQGIPNSTLYTPAVVEDFNAVHVAKTVKFKSSLYDVIYVPGSEPTYEQGGYKPCYKSLNSGEYFEDYGQTRPIPNYFLWITVGDGYLPPLKGEFNEYRETVKANCDLMLVKGDIPEVHALIDAAKANIDAYQYDNALSMAENKSALDAIFTKLAQDIAALPIPGGGGGDDPYKPQPINPVAPEGEQTAQTADTAPLAPIAALTIIAVCAFGVSNIVRRKKWN